MCQSLVCFMLCLSLAQEEEQTNKISVVVAALTGSVHCKSVHFGFRFGFGLSIVISKLQIFFQKGREIVRGVICSLHFMMFFNFGKLIIEKNVCSLLNSSNYIYPTSIKHLLYFVKTNIYF